MLGDGLDFEVMKKKSWFLFVAVDRCWHVELFPASTFVAAGFSVLRDLYNGILRPLDHKP